MKRQNVNQPEILDYKKSADRRRIATLQRKAYVRVVDDMEEQKRELAFVKNPSLLVRPTKMIIKNSPSDGKWVFLPWRNALVHVLDRSDFENVRLSRNYNLILPAEQKKFGKARIGVAGLNVGNPAAICLSLEGGGNDMKLADIDALSVSNLNRFRAGIAELGMNKVLISAYQAYEINPYARLTIYENGITPQNIDQFLNKPRIDVLVEEMDNLPLKILIRERARHFRIPVVMVTGSGPDVVIDIERYDQNPKLPILNGYLKKEIIDAALSGAIKAFPFPKKMAMMRDFMGSRFLHARLVKSFPLVGKTLAGIPQIAESSFLRGAAVTHAVRQIVTGQPMKSGRFILRLDGITDR